MSTTCAHCGHEVELGRFCTNCGAPVDPAALDTWRTDTAERPAARDPHVPPPAHEPPSSPRFPLFADEVEASSADAGSASSGRSEPGARAAGRPADEPPATGVLPGVLPGLGASGETDEATSTRRTGRLLPLVVVGLAIALVLAMGILLLVIDQDTGTGPDTVDSTSEAVDGDASSSESSTGTDDDASDSSDPGGSSGSGGSGGPSTDVAGQATAEAPVTAPPGTDVNGNTVRYDAANLVDGDDDTTWRMAGDGAGTELTFTLAGPARLVKVGLVNGYAKKEPGYDGYTANRRVQRVEWELDDGTVVEQDLRETRRMQRVKVPGAGETSQVVLRILDVSAPGDGRSGRDYTAVSEVALVAAD
ncbi:MAG: hypothetical protein CMH83_08510 [Nocardioides sp.]|nr:hypothetical protein [Nocardioides sp.]